jgi:hypothetical protein
MERISVEEKRGGETFLSSRSQGRVLWDMNQDLSERESQPCEKEQDEISRQRGHSKCKGPVGKWGWVWGASESQCGCIVRYSSRREALQR